jgi:hypothetical protein
MRWTRLGLEVAYGVLNAESVPLDNIVVDELKDKVGLLDKWRHGYRVIGILHRAE